jgi:hypothetical protein
VLRLERERVIVCCKKKYIIKKREMRERKGKENSLIDKS